jgi:mannose-6-phosphate isomerase-like protein (cupin superfamily)
MIAMPVYTNTAVQEYITKDASMIRELLNASVVPGLGMSLAEAIVEAGKSTHAHHHRDCDEIYYCLEGRGTLTINGEAFAFATGDFYLLPKGATHGLHAAERLRVLCICCPGYSHEGTVLEEE